MVEVELEADDVEAGSVLAELAARSPHHGSAPAETAGTVDAPRARRGPRLRPRVVGAVAVLGIVAAWGAHGLQAQRAEERAARAGAIPGVVAPLDEPLVATWEASTVLGVSWTDDLVLRWQERIGGVELQALEPATGQARWSVARGATDDGRGVDWCEGVAGREERPVVLCWRVSPVVVPNSDGTTTTFDGELVTLDATDGTVVSEHPTALPSSGYGVIDGDAVLAYRDGDVVRVVRTDPVTAEVVWSRELALTARQPDGSPSAWVTVEHDLVVVHGPTTLVLDADGVTLGSWDAPDVDVEDADALSPSLEGALVEVTDRGFGAWTDVIGSRRAATGTWYDRSGAALSPVEGFLAEPEVRDASLDHVVLTSSGGRELRATDTRSGQVRWSAPLEVGQVLLRRDGSAIVADSGSVFSLDLLTGARQWSVPVAGARADLGTVTDGQRVVLLARSDGRWVLHAVGLDGVPLWTSALPTAAALPDGILAGMPVLLEVDGSPVLNGSQTMVGLG